MLEIKTIIIKATAYKVFDDDVNDALKDGWELVRRDVLPSQSADQQMMLYAELERVIEAEEPEDDSTAEWEPSRSPAFPFRCSKCNRRVDEPLKTCPSCNRKMVNAW